jgi:hypothetical protein
MRSLYRRVAVLERRSSLANDRNGINLRFAKMRLLLPRDYVGERHEVLARGWPAETADRSEDCLIEQRPGPGPALHFDFGSDKRTMVVRFCGQAVAEM